jgi:hypothetical protein
MDNKINIDGFTYYDICCNIIEFFSSAVLCGSTVNHCVINKKLNHDTEFYREDPEVHRVYLIKLQESS